MEELLDPLVCVRSTPDLREVHLAHGGYVWLALQRFGVPASDLDDAFQDVFIVVQRKLDAFDGSCELTTWLHGICRRVAAARRRRAYWRREQPVADLPEIEDPGPTPEDVVTTHEADRRLAAVLDAMGLDRRATFVMFEIDGLSCAQIAAISGVAVGTVYARLHDARKEFAQILARAQARDRREGA